MALTKSEALNIAVIFCSWCQHVLGLFGSYVDDAIKTVAHVHHVRNLAPVSKEIKWCTSQHMHITIVETVHRLHSKTHIYC